MPSSSHRCKPELLAPAGSVETFYAALEAGADAIYAGLTDFNARLRAKNITAKSLSSLIPLAHRQKKKVYVTINILVKQHELPRVIDMLYQCEQLHVDGIIVADRGIIEIAKKYFPRLQLHGSTQMAIHNSIGAECAKGLGIKRVVLARELSARELRTIRQNTTVELEVFVHGALCYGISGLCLASSFLGGSSGNRGRCTQVCRRLFRSSTSEGYFFSPNDFCAIDFLPILSEIGIQSIKIEGRMKGVEYVRTVVTSYRRALDTPSAIPEIKKQLENDLGRPKTSLFLNTTTSHDIISAKNPSGTGIFVGQVLSMDNKAITIAGKFRLSSGDRIRVHPRDGFTGPSATIYSVIKNAGSFTIHCNDHITCQKGDTVYLISRKNEKPGSQFQKPVKTLPFHFKDPRNTKIVTAFTKSATPPSTTNEPSVWVKVDDIGWLDSLPHTLSKRVFLSCPINQMEEFDTNSRRFRFWHSKIWLSLPPFISELELGRWRSVIRKFTDSGIKRWVCTSIGHLSLFSGTHKLIADTSYGIINRASQYALKLHGFDYFSYSIEDDFLNIKHTVSPNGLLYIYGHVPLFISLIQPPLDTVTTIKDAVNNEFFLHRKHGLNYLIATRPLCLTHQVDRLSALGISNFIIDFSYIKPSKSAAENILLNLNNRTRIPGTSIFNYKGGLI